MKKVWGILSKAIMCILILIPIAIIAFYILGAVANDFSAKEALNEIKEIPLPEQTEIIDEISIAGKLVGNGNDMQYLGAVWIKSNLPFWQLEDYYLDFGCIVKEQATCEISIIEHGEYKFDAEKPKGRCYIVYAWGSGDGFFEYFDLRGH